MVMTTMFSLWSFTAYPMLLYEVQNIHVSCCVLENLLPKVAVDTNTENVHSMRGNNDPQDDCFQEVVETFLLLGFRVMLPFSLQEIVVGEHARA